MTAAAYLAAGNEALARGHYLTAELMLARANEAGATVREQLHRRVAAFRTRAEKKDGDSKKKTQIDVRSCCSCCAEGGCECGTEVCCTICCEALAEGLGGC